MAKSVMSLYLIRENDRCPYKHFWRWNRKIFKTARKPRVFLNLISEEAQKLSASVNYEYPVISDIELPDPLTVWGKFKEDNLPIERLADSYLEAQMIIDHVGW